MNALDTNKLHSQKSTYQREAKPVHCVPTLVQTNANSYAIFNVDKTFSKANQAMPMPVNHRNLVERFIRFINQNFNNSQLTIDMISRQLFVSKKQLERKVKAKTGTTPKAMLNSLRLEVAKSYLAKGERPSSVYAKTGFSSLGYFSKRFKERYQTLPSEYRIAQI